MNKLEIIIKALDDKLVEDIVAIDMEMASPIYDTFVICSAANERLMNALRDSVEENMLNSGFEVKKIEGRRNSKWLLMDMEILSFIFLIKMKETAIILKNYGRICQELIFLGI